MLRRGDGRVYATSWASTTDAIPGQQPRRGDPKVYLRIAVGTPLSRMVAMVDTGATYSVLDAGVARRLSALDEGGPEVELSTRFGKLSGRLVRRDVWIVSEEGPSLAFEATFWVHPEWTFGHVIGYSGLLDRMRFAIDPGRNRFHFGPLED